MSYRSSNIALSSLAQRLNDYTDPTQWTSLLPLHLIVLVPHGETVSLVALCATVVLAKRSSIGPYIVLARSAPVMKPDFKDLEVLTGKAKANILYTA